MIRYAWTLLALTLLAGCVETDAPLSDPATSEPDEALYGHWIAKQVEGDVTTEFHAFIGKHTVAGNAKGLMDIELVAWSEKEKKVERDEFRYLTATKIGKSTYLNIISAPADFSAPDSYAKWAKGEKQELGVARYAWEGKSLQIWLGNASKKSEEKIKQLVKAGSLTKQGDVLTAASLVKHLEKNGGEELFDELFLTFTKAP